MKSYIKNFKPVTSWMYIALLICAVSPTLLYATPLNPNPDPVPLDGGLLTLLAAGAAYGAKKLKISRK
jgi:hypothetical protein